LRVPGVATLPLPEGLWEVRIGGGSVWAPPLYLRNSDVASLTVWPAAPFRGISKGLTKLAVAFTPVENGGARGEAECVVEGEAWTCAVPPGRYDLRFNAAGFAPEYRFGVAAPNAEALRLQFVAGASLSGRLEAARGVRASLENVEVSLSGAQRYTAKAAANGYFQ
jgi:hypothetical protein